MKKISTGFLVLLILFLGFLARQIRQHNRETSPIAKPSEAQKSRPNDHQKPPTELSRPSKGGSREVSSPHLVDPVITGSEIYDVDGEISERLFLLAGIDVDKRELLESIVDECKNHLAEELNKKIQETEINSDDLKLKKTYHYKSDPLEAQKNKNKLFQNISATFGEGAAKTLTPYFTGTNFLGGYGSFDMNIELRVIGENISGTFSKRLTVQTIDPTTGKELGKYSYRDKSRFEQHMGTLLKDSAAAGDWNDFKE